ncbi:capsular polysaccharide transport system permease protein [Plasticicumulans lactativorans]|uniref:Transport permease protein n=1 Tax=Plasticicumulans lactativorans TaxID=1133106 RepID=A0A4R2L3N3_9GAMM|nr:ABC transporter permease [Plasticicumulans lactativorans]TCO80322.1 capsular polysaccharide transport system permease protein [Plasticicumulans lactativorans]
MTIDAHVVGQALQVQGRVILAVILRETRTRFGKHRLGYLWALAEPLLQIGVLLLMFTALGRRSPVSGELWLFFVTGIVPWLMFRNLAARVMNAVSGNLALLGYPQVTPLDLMLARIVLEAATMVLVLVVLLLGLAATGRVALPSRPLEVLAALTTLMFLGGGFGMLNAAIAAYLPAYAKVFSAVMRPLYFFSGVFYTAANLPQPARDWLLWNPLLHLIEWLRSGFFPGFDTQHLDRAYVLAWTLVLCFLGLAAERVSRRKAMQA